MDAHERFGGRSLQVRSGARVDRRAQEVVGGRVANVELDRGVELRELDQVDVAKLSGFGRWLSRERFRAKLGHWPPRRDAKDAIAADAFVRLPAAASHR